MTISALLQITFVTGSCFKVGEPFLCSVELYVGIVRTSKVVGEIRCEGLTIRDSE